MWVAFAIFLSKNISVHAIFNDQSFNDTLTNDSDSFEQPGPDRLSVCVHTRVCISACVHASEYASDYACYFLFPFSQTNLTCC